MATTLKTFKAGSGEQGLRNQLKRLQYRLGTLESFIAGTGPTSTNQRHPDQPKSADTPDPRSAPPAPTSAAVQNARAQESV
ncbi:hypothetical protein GCM10027162_60840 [Streptomyces incanus]